MDHCRITRRNPTIAFAASILLTGAFTLACQSPADRSEIISAAGGTLDATTVGPFMEARMQELQQALGSAIAAKQVRLQVADKHAIQITTTGELIFLPDSANIQPAYLPVLQAIADVVRRNGKLGVTAIGYPDTGMVNLGEHDLAYFRASALQKQLIADGVPSILANPVASNGNPMLEGQAQLLVEPVLAN